MAFLKDLKITELLLYCNFLLIISLGDLQVFRYLPLKNGLLRQDLDRHIET